MIRKAFIFQYLLIIVISLQGIFLNAQQGQLSFERVSSQKWIYQRNITCVTQDPTGYLWFGSNNGLYRFDGYAVKEFKHDAHDANTLAHNSINTVYIDAEGILWIGTWGGLNKLDPRTGIFTRYKHEPNNSRTLSTNNVQSIAEDPDGNLWVGTFEGGLNKFDKKTGEFKAFNTSPGNANSISSNYINVLVRDRSGDIWVGTRRGLNKLEPENSRFTIFQNIGAENEGKRVLNISCILEDSKGAIWFGTFGGGLMQLDRSTGKIRSYVTDPKDPSSISNNNIYDIAEEEPGRLWIATAEGLNILNVETGALSLVQNVPENPNSLLNNDVRQLFRDRSGAMWIISAEGINIYSKLAGRFRKFQRNPSDQQSLSSNIVNCFEEDQYGTIYIGTREGLTKFDRSTRKFTEVRLEAESPGTLVSNEIKSMLVDKKNRFWLGTSNGLNLYDPATNKVKVFRYDVFNANSLNNEIHTIYETRNGEIWTGSRKGILKFDPEKGEFLLFRPDPTVSENQIKNSVYSILEDRFGRFWVGTLGAGLAEFDREKNKFKSYLKNPNDSTSLSDNNVISLWEDPFGFFWVGTFGGGLNRMDRKTGKFINYTSRSGLPNDMISAILEDKDGNLWISTNSGLSKFDTRSKTFRNYDVMDGLQSNEFNIGSAKRFKSGEMIFGGIAGFNFFHPDSIQENNFIPPIVITSFKVLDKPVLLGQNIDLTYNQNYISFEFSSLSYALSDKNQFAYKLEGFDEDWIYCGSRKFVSYSNLLPGTYVFHVKGSNSDGLWNEKGITVTINIARPFWKTWWFILICVFVGLAVLYVGYRLRVRSINSQNQLLEEKVQLRTAELEKATEEAQAAKEAAEKANRSKSGFLANMSHEIRTPLNGILGFTDLLIRSNPAPEDKKHLELIRSSGDTLLRLLSDILDLNKIEQGKLTIENIKFNFTEAIQQTLIPYQFRSNEKGLQFMLSFDARIPEFVVGDPTRIKQLMINLVSNSIKFTETGGISISFEAESDPRGTDDYFYVRGMVSDTGIGVAEEKQQLIFESFTQADGSFTRKYGGSGLGLSIVKELLKLMQGDIRLISPAIEKPFRAETPGASFVFRLRVKALRTKDHPKEIPINGENKKLKFDETYKVLLVEDNMINQLLAVTVLENLGITVVTADDGQQGVDKIKNENFDLVLMDVQMPVMNGYESTLEMRRLGIELPIIGLTANVYKEDIEKCLESGMNDHLGKPFTEADLFNILKRYLKAKVKVGQS